MNKVVSLLLSAGCVSILTLALNGFRGFAIQNAPLLYLLLIVCAGALLGIGPALLTAVLSILAIDWFFTPPFHRFAIESSRDVVTLVVFVSVATVISLLVRTIKERSREVEDAQLQVRTNEVRAALLSAVSHDLRTPLASIKAAATTLLETKNLTQPQNHLLATVDRSVDRLNKMVQNLLDSSRIRTGSIDVRPQELFVEELLPPTLELIPEAAVRIDLHIPESISLYVDPILTERVLVNVLSNALAYSPEQTKVEVLARTADGTTELLIVDHGSGINVADRQLVLQPFQRLTDSTDGRGVGLGLSVANGFVAAMNGTLNIEDTPGGGTTVVLRLPGQQP